MKNLIQPSGSGCGSQAQSESGSRFKFAFSAVSLAAVLAIGLPFGTQAGTIIVPSGSIVTIQDAVDAASPGDTIKVLPGTYNETVTVTTPRIKLEADTETGPVSVGGLDTPSDFVIQADGVDIDGFQFVRGEIRISGAAGVRVSHNSDPNGDQEYLRIVVSFSSQVHIDDNFVSEIEVLSSSQVHIDHNTADSKFGTPIEIEDSSGTHLDHNVIIARTWELALLVSGSSGTHVSFNTVRAGGGLGSIGIVYDNSSDGLIDHNTVHGLVAGITVGSGCGNRFIANSVQGGLAYGLISVDDPTAPCNQYNNNDADSAFPSLEFWGVR